MKKLWRIILISQICFLTQNYAQEISQSEYIYSEKGNTSLKAYVFSSDEESTGENNPVIVIFHGGGWTMGEPSWAFGRAKHFAKLGFVAVAAQYRLSNEKDITPVEAMEDARDVIKWIRLNKNLLKINPDKLVGYGWSAGAHLAASAAIFENPDLPLNSIPNALVLVSPAVSLESDSWFKKLLLNKIEVKKVSPDDNVRKGLPPTIILQGRDDTVTPLAGVQNFANLMIENGNSCELIIFDGVGHLFTPSSERDDRFPNPDPNIQKHAYDKIDEFLGSLGYLNKGLIKADQICK